MSKLLLVNLYPFYCNAVTFQRKQLRLDNLIDPVCNTMKNAEITYVLFYLSLTLNYVTHAELNSNHIYGSDITI